MTSPKSLHYPIGAFEYQNAFHAEEVSDKIKQLERFPHDLQLLVEKLNTEQINRPYRTGGWTGRQVVHHLADSHMHAYFRTKFALLEKETEIKPYNEKEWAEAKEISSLPLSASLGILEGVHQRWCAVFNTMTQEEFSRTYLHPEYQTKVTLHEVLYHYTWHSYHHLGHLRLLLG